MTYRLHLSGDQFRAHDDNAGQQTRPQVASLADGGMIVVFSQQVQPDPDVWSFDYAITAQRYDSAGNPVGGAQTMTEVLDTSNATYAPVVAGLEGGGYAIAWRDIGSSHARIQTYDADGALLHDVLSALPNVTVMSAVGTERSVEVFASTEALTLSGLSDGGFALSWNASYSGMLAQYAGGVSAFTQTFTEDGLATGAPTQIMPWVASVSYAQDSMNWVEDSAPLADGTYVVTFRAGQGHPDNPADAPGIMARIFDSSGASVTGNFLVNQDLEVWKASPAVGTLADGSFVVTWNDGSDTYWRRFDADGEPVNDEQALGGRYLFPQVNPMEDGGFLLSMANVPGGYPIPPIARSHGARFDADGNQIGDVFVIGDARTDLDMSYLQGSATVTPLGDGPLFSVWQAHNHHAMREDGHDIIIRPFAPDLLGTAEDEVLEAGAIGTAIFGLAGNDTLIGGPGDDFLIGGPGDDLLQGGGGTNTAVFSGQQGDYDIARGQGGTLIVTDLRAEGTGGGPLDGTDTLVDIDLLQFAGRFAGSLETVAVADLELDVALSGMVTGPGGAPLDGVTLTLMAEGWPDATATSDDGGKFDFTLAAGSSAQVEAYRDYQDGDPAVNASDALNILRMAVGLDPSFGPAAPQNFLAADANGDGQVTARDALEVLRYAVGLESEYAPRWDFYDADTDWDTLGLDAGNPPPPTGIDLAALEADSSIAMTGILLGNMESV